MVEQSKESRKGTFKFLSLALSVLEIEQIKRIRSVFKLKSHAGSVRKSIAFMDLCLRFIQEDGSLAVLDESERVHKIYLTESKERHRFLFRAIQ